MFYGVNKADENDWESYVDATEMGKSLSEVFGYVARESIDLDAGNPQAKGEKEYRKG